MRHSRAALKQTSDTKHSGYRQSTNMLAILFKSFRYTLSNLASKNTIIDFAEQCRSGWTWVHWHKPDLPHEIQILMNQVCVTFYPEDEEHACASGGIVENSHALLEQIISRHHGQYRSDSDKDGNPVRWLIIPPEQLYGGYHPFFEIGGSDSDKILTKWWFMRPIDWLAESGGSLFHKMILVKLQNIGIKLRDQGESLTIQAWDKVAALASGTPWTTKSRSADVTISDALLSTAIGSDPDPERDINNEETKTTDLLTQCRLELVCVW